MPLILVIATGVQLWAGADIYRRRGRRPSTGPPRWTPWSPSVPGSPTATAPSSPSGPPRPSPGACRIHLYFETALIVVALVLMGRWLELKAKKRTAASIKTLVGLAPTTARVARATARRGRRAPRPGRRRRPRPRPARRERPRRRHRRRRLVLASTSRCSPASPSRSTSGAGDQVIGATANRTGTLVVRADAVGADSTLAQIIRLVEEAQGSQAPMQRLADQVSAWFVPAVLLAALATFIGWMTVRPRAPTGWCWPSAPPSPSSSSPAPAPWDWPRRPPSWSAPARPPSSASSSATARRWRPRAGSPPSSWTRPAPSPTAGPPLEHVDAARRATTPTSCWPWWPPPRSAASTRSARPS